MMWWIGQVRRMGAAFFVALFLLGQLHICETSYAQPTGTRCEECLALDHKPDAIPSGSIAATEHGDCHDCCALAPCHDEEKPQSTSGNPSRFDFSVAILPVAFVLPMTQERFVQHIPVLQPSAPPTGPPGTRTARAPPHFSLI